MSDRRGYYSSSHVPHSNYSELTNAVPMNYQSNSSRNYGGAQMYAPAPVSPGHSSMQAYQPGYASPAYTNQGFSAPTSQYPSTPYTSGSGMQHPNNAAHNMGYPSSQPQSFAPAFNTGPNYHGGASPYPTQYASGPVPDPGTSVKQCSNCGRLSTPLWRRDSNTGRTLCNACGLYQQHRNEPRPKTLIDADNDEEEEPIIGNGPQCSHCGTRKTSVWRRNKDGEQVCNACGVYYRVNGRERPLTMKPSKVKPRASHS